MDNIRILAVNDPAVYAYKRESSTGITKGWENKNNKVISMDILDWCDFKCSVENALENNVGNYDIVMIPSFWLAKFASENRIIPFENYINDHYKIHDIFAGILDEISYDNHLMAVPSFTDGHIVFYRKDKIKLPNIVTYSDLKSSIESIKNQKTMALKSSVYEILLDYLPFLWEEKGELIKDNQLFLDKTKAIKALENYISLRKYCVDNVENFGNEEVKESLVKGESYIGISWSGQATNIMCKDNKYRNDIGFSTYETPCNTTWMFVVNKSTKKPETCFEYLSYITNKENDLISGRISGSPIRISTYNNKVEIEKNPWYEANFDMLSRAKRVPSVKWWNEVSDKLYESIHKAFTKEITAEDAIKRCIK